MTFHANNFHNLRKSKEDVIADQRWHREEEEGDGNEDTAYRSDIEDGDFVVYNSEDEDEAEDSHFKGDILKAISYISSSINTRCDL